MRILVADEDRFTRTILRRTLERDFRCEVVEADNGLDVVEQLTRQPFALLILGLQMQVMDASEILQALRGSARGASLPVVVLTDGPEESAARELEEFGVADYLAKPLSRDRLLACVKRFVPVSRTNGTSLSAPMPASTARSDGPVMIADADPALRATVAEAMGGRYPVIEAESGLLALRRGMEHTPRAVFIGDQLGPINCVLLARKLRALPTLVDTKLIGVTQKDSAAAGQLAAFVDETIARSSDGEAFARLADRLLRPPSPLEQFARLYPSVRLDLIAATEQLFQLTLRTEVWQMLTAPSEPVEGVGATVRIVLCDRQDDLMLSVQCDTESARQLASRLPPVPSVPSPDERFEAVLAEIATFLAGRIHHNLAARGIGARCTIATVAAPRGARPDDQGMVLTFEASTRELRFRVSLESATAEAALAPHGTTVGHEA